MGQICSSAKETQPRPKPKSDASQPRPGTDVPSREQQAQKKISPKKEAREAKYIDEEDKIIINNEILVHKVQGTPLEKYQITKNLGEGSFGKVYLATQKDSRLTRAMKEIVKDEYTNDKDIENEINILKKLDHPNIVKIYEFFSYKEKYYLITEYCKDGELFEKINEIHTFEEPHAATIIYQVLLAVIYCHGKNIIHRDLKPENLLVEGKDAKGYFQIKVIDFGTAKVFDKNQAENKLIGSCYYIAPEVIKRKYNEKCDLWSVGVILYILLSGQPPFLGNDDKETFKKIENQPLNFNAKIWSKVGNEAKDLIKKLLDKNPKTRLSGSEAINHPWFQKMIGKDNLSKEKFGNFISALKDYKPNYKLQQAAIAIIVHNIPHSEDIKELERAFRIIDDNKDGRLTKDEMIHGFQNFFQKTQEESIAEVERIFKNVDNDNNGYIEYEEFIRACIDKNKLMKDDYLRFAFNFFDLDGSGQITVKEIKDVFCGGGDVQVSEEVIKKIIGNVDGDLDGQISFDEFKVMMRNILND